MPSVAKDDAALIALGLEHMASGMGRKWDIIMESGEGLVVTLSDGTKKLDFTAGIGVTNLGHCHPKITAAATKQVSTIVHAQGAIGMSRPYLQLVDRLLNCMPTPNLNSFFLWNSGSEAIEAAIKVTRRATGKNNIIVFQGSYHGRTYGASALTKSKTIYSEGVGSVMPGVYTTAFPYWHALGVSSETSEEELVRLAVYQLELLLKQQTAPTDTAAIFLEPVLGEGGYIQAPAAFLRAVRAICDKHNILLVIDEVQSGFGRTGKFFNIEKTPDVKPDVLVFAKGLANGFPLSGIATSKEIMATMPPGSLGGTYAGNAVSCAAAVAVQDVFAEEDILGNVNARSAQLFTALHAFASSPKTSHLIADVRGAGLMVGLEFNDSSDSICALSSKSDKPIPKNIHTRVQAKCYEQGLMLLTTSIYPVIRFIPALIVTEEQMATATSILKKALEEVALEG
ncbi:putative aminotransferase [Mrakia frigida]|uniref:aspartate aminotransferase family protein n=1 Tax=Mrakia frigida TaxID=29902 RepID=UPI003FCC1889